MYRTKNTITGIRHLSLVLVCLMLLSCMPVRETALAVAEPVVSGQMTIKSGTVNLTKDGTIDWVQFNSNNISSYAKKNIAMPVIRDISANKSTSGPVNDCPFTFAYTDALPGSNPVNSRGIEVR